MTFLFVLKHPHDLQVWESGICYFDRTYKGIVFHGIAVDSAGAFSSS